MMRFSAWTPCQRPFRTAFARAPLDPRAPHTTQVRRRACSSRGTAPVAATAAEGGSSTNGSSSSSSSSSAAATAAAYGWELPVQRPDFSGNKQVQELLVAAIRRPLARVRANDNAKVEALMRSIQEVGLHEPIDVLEVEGQYYGFSGCHRFEAHQRLGLETILCRVRKASKQTLMMHLR